MLVARSPAEAHLYMDLHPCPCGTARFTWSRLRAGSDSWVYEGPCDGCGAERRFDFAVAGHAWTGAGFGGAEPSRLIDPAEFLAVAQEAADLVPADPRAVPPALRDDAVQALRLAMHATEEVLKFIPPGTDTVPAAAFLTPLGHAALEVDAQRFTRAWLTAMAATYRRTLAAHSRADQKH